MTATNHALTGAIIGLATGNPWLAIPVAFASHYVLDALPHYASAMPVDEFLRTRFFAILLILDAALCFGLVAALYVIHPEHWLLAAFCAFIATSPDMFWINQYVKTRAHKPWQPGLLSRFASRIQWFQRPIGAFVELVWFIGALTILTALVR